MPPKELLDCRGYSLTLADGTPVTIGDEVHLEAPEDVYNRVMDNIFIRPMEFTFRIRLRNRKKLSRDSEFWRRKRFLLVYWDYRKERRLRRWRERMRREAVKRNAGTDL